MGCELSTTERWERLQLRAEMFCRDVHIDRSIEGSPPSPRGNPRNAAPPASYALPGARFLNVGEILIVITIRITQTIAGNRFTRTRKA